MSMASVAAQQTNAALQAAGNAASGISSTPSASTAASSGSANPLQSLSGNFNDFLQLLMTQLQNQDPTSPLDTNEFTSQLVQFASVEQQINTNSSLTQLIQLTQSGELLQAGSVVGHQVRIQSDHIPLQGGTGQVQFTAPTAEPAAIAIYSDSGQKIREVAVNASAGTNTWTWDGTDDAGNTVPDGSYRIAVIGANTDGSTSALPFTVTGTATGVQTASSGNGVQLQLGALSVDFSAVRSFVN